MNSFYGGRRGAGFEIAKVFATTTEMNNYLSVDYGKYVYCEEDSGLYRRISTGFEFVANMGAPAVKWTDI
jgi:hypothetical protein